MQLNRRITEVTGKPGKVWGNVFVPAQGVIIVKIVGDVLQASVKSGMEKSDSWIRIQNIDSVEIAETPEYALLVLGIFVALTGLGIAPSSGLLGILILLVGVIVIVYSFINKRRLLSIYSLRQTIPVFITHKPSSYQQFAENVLEIAHQLNTLSQEPSKSFISKQAKEMNT